jgi:hypothetical protein
MHWHTADGEARGTGGACLPCVPGHTIRSGAATGYKAVVSCGTFLLEATLAVLVSSLAPLMFFS